MRILYAEDERDLNDLVTRRLVAEGYGVDSCLDGQQAWDYLQAADYDAAILDIMMPHLDGLSAGGAECPAARADAFPVRRGRQQTRRGRSDAGHRHAAREARGR